MTNITDSISYLSNKIVNSYKDNYESDKLKNNIENKKIVSKRVLTMKITNEMTSEELKTVLSKILDDLIKDEDELHEIIQNIYKLGKELLDKYRAEGVKLIPIENHNNIEELRKNPKYLHTVTNVGYKLTPFGKS